MRPQSIFKILALTLICIVVLSFTLEMYNAITSSHNINTKARIAARQAAVLFGQETYIRPTGGFVGNMQGLNNNTGAFTVNGNFFIGGTPELIHQNMFVSGGTSGEFIAWAEAHRHLWRNIDLMMLSINNENPPGRQIDRLIGDTFIEHRMTPLNMGVPYLDRATIERIMRWNLAMILNNGQINTATGGMANMHRVGGRDFVLYNGFRVFINELTVEIDYEVVNLVTQADRFNFLTGMNAATLVSGDERDNIMIAGISYSVPVQYVGVTPIANIAEFFWENRVQGIAASGAVATDWDGMTATDPAEALLQGGGFIGHSDWWEDADLPMLPIPGRVIYYIIR